MLAPPPSIADICATPAVTFATSSGGGVATVARVRRGAVQRAVGGTERAQLLAIYRGAVATQSLG